MSIDKSADSKLYGSVKITIRLPADFPEKYRDAVVKAAESCTVKKHIQTPPRFEVVWSA